MVQVMVTHAPKDCNLTFQKTEKVILDSLQRITTLHRSKGHQLPYLCGVLKIIGHEVTPEYAFNMLRDIAALFPTSVSPRMASHLTSVVVEYMDIVLPQLMRSLDGETIIQTSVFLVSQVCGALGARSIKYCDAILHQLFKAMAKDDVHRFVKEEILSVLGNMSREIGPGFMLYLDQVLVMLQQVSLPIINQTVSLSIFLLIFRCSLGFSSIFFILFLSCAWFRKIPLKCRISGVIIACVCTRI